MTANASGDHFFTPISEGSDDFFTPIKEPSRTRSILGAPIKGAIKEAADIAELFQKVPLPKGEFNPKKVREFAEEKFPTQEKGPEKFLERAGRLGIGALLSPGGPIAKGAQILGGAALGQGLEEIEAPPWAQAIAESLPFFYKGGKKIPLKSSQKRVGEFLRKEGLTENEITPLLKSPEQLERWGKFASKGKKSRQLMESIYHKSGSLYDTIESRASQLPNATLNPQAATSFLQETTKIIQGMPSKYRNLIKEDALDLIKSNGHFNDLTNFYKDVNAVIGAEHGGRAIVGQFKGPVVKAMESISPELASDFTLANDLYRTRINVAGKLLNKKQIDDLLDVGEIATLGAGVFNRDLGLIGQVIGASGARKIAREMLINPRLQSISIRIGEALKKNKFSLAEKYMKEFKSEVEKDDTELASIFPIAKPRQ